MYAYLFVEDPIFQVLSAAGIIFLVEEFDAVKLPLRSPLISSIVAEVETKLSAYTYAHLFVVCPRFQVELAAGTTVFAVLEDATKLPVRSPFTSTCAVVPIKLSA